MFTETIGAIGAIKAAGDIAKGIASLNNEAERNQAIIDIQRTLLEAQSAALGDKETISKLRDQIAKLQQEVDFKQDWAKEKQRYILSESRRGVYFYDLRREFAAGEISHRLCATCFENGRKSLLHTTKTIRGGEHVECMICKVDLQLEDHGAAPQTRNDHGANYY